MTCPPTPPVPSDAHNTSVPVTPPRRRGPLISTSPVERLLVDRLGGAPWTHHDASGSGLDAAISRWADLRRLLGYSDTSTDRWMTDDAAKLNKTVGTGGIKSVLGVTLLSAHGARGVWASLSVDEQSRWGGVLGITAAEISHIVRHTVCECSTRGCRVDCVVATSLNARIGSTPRTRLARTLLTLVHPAEALELTRAALIGERDRYGRDAVRWRMNIGDDVRWELVAPGLLGIVPAYAYTKHPVADRPEIPSLTRIVYSVDEHWSEKQVIDTCAEGHSVAMVFDIGRNEQLPSSWRGVAVVNGNVTDDLWAHPYGVIVGLNPKGPTNAALERLAASGFARPVDPT